MSTSRPISESAKEMLDLSYVFDKTTLHWPGKPAYEHNVQIRGPTGNIKWIETNTFSVAEHSGTHMDAPAHMSEGQWRLNDIPTERFIGPIHLIDISKKAEANRDAQMEVSDILEYEKKYGQIKDGSIMMMNSGWGARYPDRLAYMGSNRTDKWVSDEGVSLLHFPGISPEAARWITENRKPYGVGVDTASLDHGPSLIFETHSTLFKKNIYGLEYLANLDQVPPVGAKAYVFPMNIGDGSGGPVRVVAEFKCLRPTLSSE